MLAELAVLPEHLKANQVSRYAGLDLRLHQSGTNVQRLGQVATQAALGGARHVCKADAKHIQGMPRPDTGETEQDRGHPLPPVAGSTHAAQGDGEVCGTAIESPMCVILTVDVKAAPPPFPAWNCRPPAVPLRSETAGGHLVTTGIGPDLMTATRDTVRELELIAALGSRHGLTPEYANCLTSARTDLYIAKSSTSPLAGSG